MNLRPIRIEGDLAFIPLTKGYEAVIDAVDVPLVAGKNWCAAVAKNTVYAVTRTSTKGGVKAKTLHLHRFLMSAPANLEVDHKDCNGLDNRRKNLRLATRAQNQQNKQISRSNTSGFKGVSWCAQSKKWRATVCLNGKTKRVGTYATPELAHASYAAACFLMHGEFGRAA